MMGLSPETVYWVGSIFFWLFFTGLGLPPVPEEAGILYAGGLSSLHPDVPWWLAWPAASAGIMCADMALYGLGRLLGPRIFQYRWVNRLIPLERRQRLEQRFHEHGMKFLLLSRLLPPLRTGVFLIAGSSRYSFPRFLLADAIYGLTGVGIVFFGGGALVAAFHYLGGWLLLIGGVALAIFLLYRYYRYLKNLELKVATRMMANIAPAATPPADK